MNAQQIYVFCSYIFSLQLFSPSYRTLESSQSLIESLAGQRCWNLNSQSTSIMGIYNQKPSKKTSRLARTNYSSDLDWLNVKNPQLLLFTPRHWRWFAKCIPANMQSRACRVQVCNFWCDTWHIASRHNQQSSAASSTWCHRQHSHEVLVQHSSWADSWRRHLQSHQHCQSLQQGWQQSTREEHSSTHSEGRCWLCDPEHCEGKAPWHCHLPFP